MQVLDIITDATILKRSKALGSSIIRFANGSGTKSQLHKAIWLLDAQQSFEAEILCGLKSIELILKDLDKDDISEINWICDVEYLSSLYEKKLINPRAEINNKILDQYLIELVSAVDGVKLKIHYPRNSSDRKYHHLCHRICTGLRQILIGSQKLPSLIEDWDESIKICTVVESHLNRYKDWRLLP